MSRQTFQETLWWSTVGGTAVANTTTETIVFPNVTIPANYFQGGRTLYVKAQGEHSTTGTPTLLFHVRWGGVGGTIIGLTPTFTTGSGMSHKLWQLDFEIQCRADGASGTLVCIGDVTVQGATVPGQLFCVGGDNTPAATTCDLTADTALSLTATWGTASSSNTLTGWNYVGESQN